MALYKIVVNDTLGNPAVILRTSDFANIPVAPGNRDFDEYQKWVAEGNVPDPIDPVPPPIDLKAAWITAKGQGTTAALDFLAGQLGLL